MRVKYYLSIAAVVGVLLAALPGLCVTTNVEVEKEGLHYIEVTTVRFDEADLDGLDVDTASGSIHCERWDKRFMEVRVVKKSRKYSVEEAKDEFSLLDVEASVVNGCADVEIERMPFFTKLSVEVFCSVPAGRDVELETGGGEVRINGIEGGVKAKTGGGHLDASDCHGPVSLTTGGGDIDVRRCQGSLTAKTGGGDVSVQTCSGDIVCKSGGGDIDLMDCGGGVTAKTGGGDVKLRDCRSGVEAKTGGGSIDAEDCHGAVSLTSGGGDIEASRCRGRLIVNTGGGAIRVDGAERVDASTGGGAIRLFGVSGSVDASTGGGLIVAEACGLSLDTTGHFRLDSGGGDVRLRIPPRLPLDISVRLETARRVPPRKRVRCFFPLERHQTGRRGVFKDNVLTAKGKRLGGGFLIEIETRRADVVIEPCDR